MAFAIATAEDIERAKAEYVYQKQTKEQWLASASSAEKKAYKQAWSAFVKANTDAERARMKGLPYSYPTFDAPWDAPRLVASTPLLSSVPERDRTRRRLRLSAEPAPAPAPAPAPETTLRRRRRAPSQEFSDPTPEVPKMAFQLDSITDVFKDVVDIGVKLIDPLQKVGVIPTAPVAPVSYLQPYPPVGPGGAPAVPPGWTPVGQPFPVTPAQAANGGYGVQTPAESDILYAVSAPFTKGTETSSPRTFALPNPRTGRLTWFGPRGRPILWSRDLSVCKRVRKIGARARRYSGGR